METLNAANDLCRQRMIKKDIIWTNVKNNVRVSELTMEVKTLKEKLADLPDSEPCRQHLARISTEIARLKGRDQELRGQATAVKNFM